MDDLIESIFGFQAARDEAWVRAFYGDYAYEAIKKWERDQREYRGLMARRAPGLVDDVGSQWLGAL